MDFFSLDRCGRLLTTMLEEDVLPHVASSIIRTALEGLGSTEATELLDWCEIAIHVCRQKKRAGQTLRNSAGLLVKIIKDPETRGRIVSQELERTLKNSFRNREEIAERQYKEDLERTLILEYEHSRIHLADVLFQDMPDTKKTLLRKQKAEVLRQHERFQRISPDIQEREIDAAVLQDIARKEAPPFEKWRLRKQAQQAILAFAEFDQAESQGVA